ncbi:MAG: DUF3298 and DUF4163 domain-containing protein [Clostridia bacterium]|nr:DUF3298 and DUF4163 domain-containing protein [Clostridia bacterium]
MNEIKFNTVEKQLYYQGEVIVKYSIEYPEIVSSPYEAGKQVFNMENRKKALDLKEFAEGEFYEQAKEVYEYNKKNGYPIMMFELYLTTTLTYQSNKVISIYQDEYTFTGGAHGSTIRTAQNWDLPLARIIDLQDFYPNNPYYLIEILKQINSQIAERIKQEPSTYFDDYCQLVLESFRLENYYLTPKGIVIFFQQYDIAPYSTGIPTFLISKRI